MKTKSLSDPNWDGRTSQGRDWAAYRSWVQLSEQWGISGGRVITPEPVVDGVSGLGPRATGETAGTMMSRSILDCDGVGFARSLCGACQGNCEALFVVSYNAPAGKDGMTTRDWQQIDMATG